MEDYVTRRRDNINVQRPALISDYNRHMGGVDHMDQFLVYYAIGRKSIKWYKIIFWRVLDMAIVNGFVLYNLCHEDKPLYQKNYRLELADALVSDYIEDRASDGTNYVGRRSSYSDCRLKGKHFATSVHKKGRCVLCGNKMKPNGKRKDTKVRNFCPKCQVYLCKNDCFKKYHTNYRL